MEQEFSRSSYESFDEQIYHIFASPEDVILNKLEWFKMTNGTSEHQWGDIAGILHNSYSRLDIAYLRHWASQLGVAPLLEKALQEHPFS